MVAFGMMKPSSRVRFRSACYQSTANRPVPRHLRRRVASRRAQRLHHGSVARARRDRRLRGPINASCEASASFAAGLAREGGSIDGADGKDRWVLRAFDRYIRTLAGAMPGRISLAVTLSILEP
jgi:hypothetical protein